MKVYRDISLEEFRPWSGATDRFEFADLAGLLPEIEQLFDDVAPDGISETELNDYFWFDFGSSDSYGPLYEAWVELERPQSFSLDDLRHMADEREEDPEEEETP